MKSSTTAQLFGVVLGLLLTGSCVRADLVHWSYSWSSSPGQVLADSPGTSLITLSDASLQNVVGNSYIVATNLTTTSTAPDDQPDHFTNQPYTLSLTILDQSSNTPGTVSFGAELNGTLSTHSANITSTPTTSTTQFLLLGNYLYTATLAAFSPPGPPDSTNAGSISTLVSVTVTLLPEPSSLILAGFGVALLGLLRFRNSHRPPLKPT